MTTIRKYGHTIKREREATPNDPREYWTATCRCGWWNYGLTSRRAANAALMRHHAYDARHR